MKHNVKILFRLMLVLIIIAGAAAWRYYTIFQKTNVNEGGGTFQIYNDYSYEDMIKAIDTCGALINTKHFIQAAKSMKLEEGFKDGNYVIKAGMNNKAIVRMLQHGWQTPIYITLSGYIRSYESLASKFGAQLEADSAAFASILLSENTMSEYGFKKETFLGMFIPNTYEVYWTSTPKEMLDRMKKEYDAFWNESRCAKAAEIGLSKEEVSTLASIVIEETKYEPEMPTIAGVYMNRLKKGMLLQADPTVKFALNDASVRRILNVHLKVDSPYNTYKYKGLPPGPITIPPIVALDAVLNYQRHNYIYFCARDTFDGQHFFATSYTEHLKNARRYQKALTARQKANK